LGINAVELMPIFEFDEMESYRIEDNVSLYNYWGYNTVSFFSPNTAYTSVREHNHEGDELKRLILELKENGIEVILDVVFNHTAEGNEYGPTFSFKGIDNDIFYILTPDGHYYNFSGCGNVMNCNNPVVSCFIITCLQYWVIEYRVDGFRFDLASILSRGENGAPMENPPILQSIACDPILGKVKLIAEAWDAGGLYQVGSFPAWGRWAEWNGRYRDDLRRFLKGDEGMAGAAIARITGSRDMYNVTHRGPSASVNFLTCHDGFTMYDLYSYNTKHNEKNGWNNTDGDNNGNSWNCGAEGETNDPHVKGLRRRMVKNAFATLMCSRGPAMFYAGDEFCNTQFGNNNAYCQDNIISWLDWSRLDEYKEIHDFFRYMIAFRKKHPILRKTTKQAACGWAEITTHNGTPWNVRTDNHSRLIGIMYAGRDLQDKKDDIVFYGMNAYWEPLPMQLPEAPYGMKWKLCVNTFAEYEDGKNMAAQTDFRDGRFITVPPRTVMVFEAEEVPVDHLWISDEPED
jgi:glycogen operon protein